MNLFSLFAVLLLVTQALVPATGKTPDNGARNSHTQNQSADTRKNPDAPRVSPPTKDGDGPALKPDANKDSSNFNQSAINITNPTPVPVAWGWREWVIWGANLALAIVGIGGIVVAVFTLCFIKRQAVEMRLQRIVMRRTLVAIRQQGNTMKEQTDVLEKTVAVTMNAERAWIIDEAVGIAFNPTPGVVLRGNFTLTNRGRIPACITNLKIGFIWINLSTETNYPEIPPYNTEPFQFLEIGPSGLVVAPDQSFTFSKSPEDTPPLLGIQMRGLYGNPPLLAVSFYGEVTYNNGFEEGRLTQFCYTWRDGEFRRIGPSGYNHAT